MRWRTSREPWCFDSPAGWSRLRRTGGRGGVAKAGLESIVWRRRGDAHFISIFISMSNIEIVICLLLLFMAVPDFCHKLGRPALEFPAFVLFGMALAPLASEPVATMLHQAGQVGFLLLLFAVGLEIDLPPFREFL